MQNTFIPAILKRVCWNVIAREACLPAAGNDLKQSHISRKTERLPRLLRSLAMTKKDSDTVSEREKQRVTWRYAIIRRKKHGKKRCF